MPVSVTPCSASRGRHAASSLAVQCRALLHRPSRPRLRASSMRRIVAPRSSDGSRARWSSWVAGKLAPILRRPEYTMALASGSGASIISQTIRGACVRGPRHARLQASCELLRCCRYSDVGSPGRLLTASMPGSADARAGPPGAVTEAPRRGCSRRRQPHAIFQRAGTFGRSLCARAEVRSSRDTVWRFSHSCAAVDGLQT